MSAYWYAGQVGLGVNHSGNNTGTFKYWIAGQSDNWFPAAAFSTETGTAVMGLSGVSFNGAGNRQETANSTLALSGVSFNGAGSRQETATANLALGGVAFNSVGSIIHIKATATMALRGVSISASGFNAGIPGAGLRQFWTC